MDPRTPVSRLRHVGAFLLVCTFLLLAACKPQNEAAPPAPDKKPIAAEAPPKAETPQGFALASTRAEPYQGQLALTLEFTQPVVGTQAFDTLIAVTGAKGETVQGSWALDEDAKTLRFPYVQADASYTVRIKGELAAVDGKTLGSEVAKEVYTGPMQPAVGFASQGSVLPARETRGFRSCRSTSRKSTSNSCASPTRKSRTSSPPTRRTASARGYELDPRYGWYGRKGKPVAGIAESVYVEPLRAVRQGQRARAELSADPEHFRALAVGPVLRRDEARRQLRRRIRNELLLRQRHRPAHARVQGSTVRARGIAENRRAAERRRAVRARRQGRSPSSPARPTRTATCSSPIRSMPSTCSSRTRARTSRCCRSTSRRWIFPISPSPGARKPGSTCSAGPIAICIGPARRFAFPRCCAITTAIRSSRSRCS